jgi:hypothetical protein
VNFKEGVRLRGVRTEIVFAMLIADEVHREVTGGVAITITSVTDGVHGERSFHHNGAAFDGRTKELTPEQRTTFLTKLRERLSQLPGVYQMIFEDAGGENEHVHVEHDDGHERPWTTGERDAEWIKRGWTLVSTRT